MSAETSTAIDIGYERRLELADKLAPSFVGDDSSGRYFSLSILPVLLPEAFRTQGNVTPMHHNTNSAIRSGSQALGQLLHFLVEEEALELTDAHDCATSLDVEFTPHMAIEEIAHGYTSGEAQLYWLHVKKIQTEARDQLASVGNSAVPNARTALRLV